MYPRVRGTLFCSTSSAALLSVPRVPPKFTMAERVSMISRHLCAASPAIPSNQLPMYTPTEEERNVLNYLSILEDRTGEADLHKLLPGTLDDERIAAIPDYRARLVQ